MASTMIGPLACSSSGNSPSLDAQAVESDGGGQGSDAGADATDRADAISTSSDASVLGAATVLDLTDLKTNPTPYAWFDFRPNVKKLILTGAAETQHVAVLWYTTVDGGVGLHYHAKTESVYVIDGTQTDAKGLYPTGTVYFNPPGSGHQITDSSGFFLLAYAAPPDFMSTSSIGEYTPLRLDTTAADLTTANAFQTVQEGVATFTPPLDATGGLSATFIESTSTAAHLFRGNYLLVLKGSCDIEGMTLTKDWLVVGKMIEPLSYKIAATAGASCLAMGVSF